MKNKFESSIQAALPGRAMSPETAQPSAGEIAALAYELWKARGCPEGSADADWLLAEERLKSPGEGGQVMAA